MWQTRPTVGLHQGLRFCFHAGAGLPGNAGIQAGMAEVDRILACLKRRGLAFWPRPQSTVSAPVFGAYKITYDWLRVLGLGVGFRVSVVFV